MRPIKFRGFNEKHKQWLTGNYILNRGAHFIAPVDEFADGKTWDDYEVRPDTVGQFTGLTDKQGREIYEGDIYTRDKNRYCCDKPYCVHYRNGSWIGVAHNKEWLTLNDDADEPYRDDLPYIEVIGNVHDNPTLLTNK